MRSTVAIVGIRKLALAAFVVSLSACKVETTPSIEIELGGQTLQLVQGQSNTVQITVTRTDFDGEVALTATGLPTGVTAAFTPPTIAGDVTQATLTLTATNTAIPGAATVTIEAIGTGIDTKEATLDLTVQVAGNYTLTAAPSSVSVTQGADAASTVTITRTGGFAQDVTFSASGLPSGVTASFNPTTAGGTASTVTFAAAANAATGTVTVTITGATPGLSNQTTTVALTVNPPPSITVSTGSTLTVAQGANNTLTVTVARTNFTGDVALAASGLPAGVTASFNPGTITTGTTSTLTVAANATATPGNATVTVTASGTGITNATTTFTLTVNVTGSYTLAASPSSVTVAQGGATQSTITLTKSGGFAQSVSLAASGLPSGVTAAFSPSSVSGTSSTLTLNAAADAATGSSTVTVTGTTPGLANQTTTINLTVQTPPPTQQLTLDFCEPDDVPVWLAIQNEGGAWTRITGTANGTFTAQVTSRFGLAVVFSDISGGMTSGYDAEIHYVTFAEMAPLNGATCVVQAIMGPKMLSGTVAGLASGRSARINVANTGTSASGPDGNYNLTSVLDGPLDLVATRIAPLGFDIDKLIIRRGVNYPSGSTIPVLDFADSEAIDPARNSFTLTGTTAGEDNFARVSLLTNSTSTPQTFAELWSTHSLSSGQFPSVPAASTIAGDVHEFIVHAAPSGGHTDREFYSYFRNPTNVTAALGPNVSTPTVTQVSTAPYARYRFQVASQTEYNGGIFVGAFQINRNWMITMTSGYNNGSVPTTWDLTMPDFSAVSGWDNAYGLQSGTVNYEVMAFSAGGNPFGAIAPDGTSYRIATYFGDTATPNSMMRSITHAPSRPRLRSAMPRRK